MFAKKIISGLLLVITICTGCKSVNDNRIPVASVRIEVSLAQQQKREYWASVPTAHVAFVKPNSPYGFPYSVSSATGYGGVLQVCGYDNELFAFDLSCPFEHSPTIRVRIDEKSLNAVCPECGSAFDVFYGSGAPIEGPAAKEKYSLRRYMINHIPSTSSYIIIN